MFYSDGYNKLRTGMTIETILASTRADFAVVTALTDCYVPACDTWVGDYPYVNKSQFRRFASSISKKSYNRNNEDDDSASGNDAGNTNMASDEGGDDDQSANIDDSDVDIIGGSVDRKRNRRHTNGYQNSRSSNTTGAIVIDTTATTTDNSRNRKVRGSGSKYSVATASGSFGVA